MHDVTSRDAAARPVLPRRSGAPVWLATAIVVVALLSLTGALFPATASVADGSVSTVTLFVPALPSLQWVVVLLLVAAAVAARKRAGWFAVLLFAVASLLLDVTALSAAEGPPLDWTLAAATLFHLVVTVLLLVWYREFPARVRSRALLRVTLTVVIAVAAATAVGWIVVSLFPGHLPGDARLSYAFNGVVGDVFDESVVPRSGPPPWVDSFLSVLETVTTLSVVVALFRSRRAANAMQPQEEAATRALLERFGAADSLGYFATRRDKSVVFGPDGRAAVTYRVEAGVCLASGDPVGAPGSWDGAIRAWLDLASRFGWATAVLGASASGALAYRRHGLAVLDLGDEAVVDTNRFSLRGPDAAALRQAATRAGRDGVTVRIRRQHQVPPEELTRAGELADAWRGAEPERGAGPLGGPVRRRVCPGRGGSRTPRQPG